MGLAAVARPARPRAPRGAARARAARGCRRRPPPAAPSRAAGSPARRRGRARGRARALRGAAQRGAEAAAAAELALDRHVPAEQAREPARDRETEARAALPARALAVGLGERLEQPRLLLGADPDARVDDLERRALAVGADRTRTSPSSVNLIALPTRLTRIWRARVTSVQIAAAPWTAARRPGAEPFACARWRSSSATSSASSTGEHATSSSGSLPDSIFAASSTSSRTRSRCSPLRWIGAQRGLGGRCAVAGLEVEQELLGEAEDRGHRRADLVAHRGEELGLRLRGALRLAARGLGRLARAVHLRPQHALALARGCAERAAHGAHAHDHRDRQRAAGRQEPGPRRADRGRDRRRDQRHRSAATARTRRSSRARSARAPGTGSGRSATAARTG